MKFICGANHFLFFFRVGILSRRVTLCFRLGGVGGLQVYTVVRRTKVKGDEQEKKHDEQPFNVGDVSFNEWSQ